LVVGRVRVSFDAEQMSPLPWQPATISIAYVLLATNNPCQGRK
jgi:hypothetical protein